VAEQENVSARLDALARQLSTTRSIALVLAAAVVGLSAWTIYAQLRKPEKTITLDSEDGTLTLSATGIRLTTKKTNTLAIGGGITLEEEKNGGSLMLLPSRIHLSRPAGAEVVLSVSDRGQYSGLMMDTENAHVLVQVGNETSLSVLSKKHHVTLKADDHGGAIDGSGPPAFALGTEQPTPQPK
jgi:hypothetical protein